MSERDQGFVYPEDIREDVEGPRPDFPLLSKVHELWICDTATLGAPREWVEFVRHQDGGLAFEVVLAGWLIVRGVAAPAPWGVR